MRPGRRGQGTGADRSPVHRLVVERRFCTLATACRTGCRCGAHRRGPHGPHRCGLRTWLAVARRTQQSRCGGLLGGPGDRCRTGTQPRVQWPGSRRTLGGVCSSGSGGRSCSCRRHFHGLGASLTAGPLQALGWSLLAFVVLGPVVWPWYETWGFVFLAVVAEAWTLRLLLALSAVACFADLPSVRYYEAAQPVLAIVCWVLLASLVIAYGVVRMAPSVLHPPPDLTHRRSIRHRTEYRRFIGSIPKVPDPGQAMIGRPSRRSTLTR